MKNKEKTNKVRKMSEIELKRYDETTVKEEIVVEERLTHPSDDCLIAARGHESLSWTHGWMSNHHDGQLKWFTDMGLMLQKVNSHTVRCVAVTDHKVCYGFLSMMRANFLAASIDVQIDPYTVVIPYNEPPEQEAQEDPPQEAPIDVIGVEVV